MCRDLQQLNNGKFYENGGQIVAKGKITWITPQGNKTYVPIENVKVDAAITDNVVAIDVLLNKGFHVKFEKDHCNVYRFEQLILRGNRERHKYVINNILSLKEEMLSVDEVKCPDWDLQHVTQELINYKDIVLCAHRIVDEYVIDEKQTQDRNFDVNELKQNNLNIKCETQDWKSGLKSNEESEATTDAVFLGSDEGIKNVTNESEPPYEIYNGVTVSDSRVKLTEGDIEKTVFDATVAINLNLEFDRPTGTLSETEINVGNDDSLFSKYESDSVINSMDFIIMNSLSLYAECEYLKAHKSFKVSKHFNNKEVFKRPTKTAERSFKYKQSKKPPDSLSLLQPSVPLPKNILYGGKLDYSNNIEKIKSKLKKRNSKIARTYECNVKIQACIGSTGSDIVIIAKQILKFDVITRFICQDSERVPIYPVYGVEIFHVMNECPEDMQEYHKVFSCLLSMDISTTKEEKQFTNNYNHQPITEEQMWQNQLKYAIGFSLQTWSADRTLERQVIADVLKETVQFHLKTKIRYCLMNWKARKRKCARQHFKLMK